MRLLEKRSVSLAGHATSVALEPEFWSVLEMQAKALGETVAQRLIAVDAERGERPLASRLPGGCARVGRAAGRLSTAATADLDHPPT